ncbi:hypothetical protein [Nitrosopumilus sp.]|uniref:hypothetical protein n=1 Tax=Nitrosopumilus sp. TaxID=2024843 RepID=UPI0026056281|nr:hypothetical protein [Nitrosopumilus sp.]
MEKFDQEFKINFIVAILFISGITIILFNTMPEFEKANIAESLIDETEKIPLYEINKPITLNLFPVVGQSNATDLRILITFQQSVVYAGDEVEYHARIVTDQQISNIQAIAIIFDHENVEYTKHTRGQIFQEINTAGNFGHAIVLGPDMEEPFSLKGKIPFPVESEVFVTGFIIRENGFETLNLDEPILKIFPTSAKLETEANRALLAQAEQQRISSLVQDISNARLLALTWVGVGAIPIIIGADILIRVYLRESEVNKWFREKTQPIIKWRKGEHEIIK